ncbi:hypothetical protein A3765_12460 [Oleiphilus sp. HI0130]|nr:hypothetical protein A3758_21800 [Oleiphilus sp. HI0118]KZZ43707.1 hypothetical protein A3758_03700 [Oleiphilus sp. HI0118]KZZ73404.1 hypothetical protein A3765_12460 [Oleiphilus sp. HI0130]
MRLHFLTKTAEVFIVTSSSEAQSKERSYHHGDLKSALIDAALQILDTRGIEALSLRALASEVGVSHMAPYAHFKNKTELFQAIAASGFQSLTRRMQAVQDENNAIELILNYGTQYIEFAIANPALYKIMLSQTQTAPEMTMELQQASKEPHALLVQAFEKLPNAHSPANLQAQGAWAMVHGLSALITDGHLLIPDGMSVKQYLAATSTQMPHS